MYSNQDVLMHMYRLICSLRILRVRLILLNILYRDKGMPLSHGLHNLLSHSLFLANSLNKHSSLREGLREFRMPFISIYKKGNLLFTGNVGERKGSKV